MRQLNARANQLAHYLIERRAWEPEERVGLCVERGGDGGGMLGILKAGGGVRAAGSELSARAAGVSAAGQRRRCGVDVRSGSSQRLEPSGGCEGVCAGSSSGV